MMIMIFLWEFRVELIFHNYLLTLTIHDLIGSLRNHDDDGNGDVTEQKV